MNTPTDDRRVPGECRTLDQVRVEIDRLDAEIVQILAVRAGYVARAATFKPVVEDVVVPERIESIVAKVRDHAVNAGVDPSLIERIYRAMIEAFIAYERSVWLKRPNQR